MISFSNINKQYGKQLLFVDASFQLNPGEKVGLVGPNGAGKTTLFRMVVGEETPDEGAVDKTHRRLFQDRLLPGRLDPLNHVSCDTGKICPIPVEHPAPCPRNSVWFHLRKGLHD
jgi:ABC-type molybdenum transport system ATPase subunit/photorepair protein PhrA